MQRACQVQVPADAQEDHDLIVRIARHEEQALATLHAHYHRLVYTIAFRVVNDHMLAEEIAQDVFRSVW